MLIHRLGKVDIKNKWVHFDGTHVHQTYPFTKNRYSFVFFSIRKCNQADEKTIQSLMDIGFPRSKYKTPFTSDDVDDETADRKAKEAADKKIREPC